MCLLFIFYFLFFAEHIVACVYGSEIKYDAMIYQKEREKKEEEAMLLFLLRVVHVVVLFKTCDSFV